jgi:uncharacterized membrane protein YphA (DoxX/SURF4 family)
MTDWVDTLATFSAVIRTGADFASSEIVCPRYAETRGVEVYRNNYRGNLHDTLAGAYPVIRQLVGDEFFRLLAKHFIEQHPSQSGNLHRYGSELAAFLARFEHTRQLVYLPDMARLEWAYHHAYFASDEPPFALVRLAAVAPEAYYDLRWRLHPGCSLINSAYPVSMIWQAHVDGMFTDFRINIHSGGERLLVHRTTTEVEIIRITAASFHWLSLQQQGYTMGAATEESLSIFPEFDVATTLQHWIAAGVLIDLSNLSQENTGKYMSIINRSLSFYYSSTRFFQHATPLLDMALRLYLANVFFKSGLTKIQTWDSTLYLFSEEYRVPLLSPEFAAYLATGAELALPVLLVLGLFGRFAALGLLILNEVAAYSYYDQLSEAGLNQHLHWGLLLAVLLLYKQGKWSADAWWRGSKY